MNGMFVRVLHCPARVDVLLVAMTRAKRHLVSFVQVLRICFLPFMLLMLPVHRRRLVDGVSRRELSEEMACVARG